MMKKAIVFTAFIGGALLIMNCSPKATGSMASGKATPEAAVAEVKAKYSEAQLDEGKSLWQGNCGKCHKLFEPESRPVKQWEKILPRMSKKAGLSGEQAGKVRAFVLTHATSVS